MPGPVRFCGTRPGTLANIPFEAEPARSIVDCWAKPSGASSLTVPLLGPSTATLSLIRRAPFSSVSPASRTASGAVRGDRAHQAAVAGGRRVPGAEAGDRRCRACAAAPRKVLRLAEAGRVVAGVEDVGALDPLLLGEARQAGALVGVVGDDAGVVAPRRVEALRARPCAARGSTGSGRSACCRARPSPGRRRAPGRGSGSSLRRSRSCRCRRRRARSGRRRRRWRWPGTAPCSRGRSWRSESSQAWKATLRPPARQSAPSSTSRIASFICSERCRESPCSGRSETISACAAPVPPYWTGAAGRRVDRR